jgi:hypothetical protein
MTLNRPGFNPINAEQIDARGPGAGAKLRLRGFPRRTRLRRHPHYIRSSRPRYSAAIGIVRQKMRAVKNQRLVRTP